ncbi:DUF4276 family protein [Lentimicrobium sp. S6]|uniref:DUF4276 family protein n=1 Tax=Lentimicrobium sp. S6 TaxID=2735872 RepID=UPI001551FBA4|nr:DUF4276 family protein [Lentimicrobium sp. S6]NPD47599.1 DUF4276 family protein [Lentimicrobium sp. S6]
MATSKIAFFVEGLTEQEFVKKLLAEVFGEKDIMFEIKAIMGSPKTKITLTSIESPIIDGEKRYYILIYNCGGDSSIKSYILDQRNGLIKSGYSKIIGLRDVYPDVERQNTHRLLTGLNYKLPQKDIPISFVLSIMEIESWFIAEENHFQNIDAGLTPVFIETHFGFNPSTYNTELIDEPAKMLNDVYQLVGKSYRKKNASITRTINAMDYHNIYFNTHNRISSIGQLIGEIEEIFH